MSVRTANAVKSLAAAGAMTLALAGCGDSTTPSTSSTSVTPGSSAAHGTSTPAAGGTQTDQVVIDVTIANGTVTPTNQQLQATVKQPIVVRVNSDADDHLHVHSNPEHSFDIKPGNGQVFQFTVDVPGKVDVELHHLDKTVATITVQ